MRKFLATTALVAVMSTGATGVFAAAHSSMFMNEAAQGEMRASEFIGMRLYAAEVSDDEVKNLRVRDNMLVSGDDEREWNDIGEVNDVLLTRDGNVGAVLVDIGGFLGLGEKTVAVGMDQIKFVSENDEGEGEYFLVINSTQDALESAPEFDTAVLDGDIMDNETAEAEMTSQAEVATDMNAETAEATTEMKTETNDTMAETRMFPPKDFAVDGYSSVESNQLTAEDLDGARVYGVNDEDVGEISALLLTEEGKITAAVIDVGGFLGIGEKSVEVNFDQLSVQKENEGRSVRIYIDASEDSLKQLPEYEG